MRRGGYPRCHPEDAPSSLDCDALGEPLGKVNVDGSETTDGTAKSGENSQQTTSGNVERVLTRARKAAGQGFDENREQVRFMLEEARILGLLQVAAAIRADQDDART